MTRELCEVRRDTGGSGGPGGTAVCVCVQMCVGVCYQKERVIELLKSFSVHSHKMKKNKSMPRTAAGLVTNLALLRVNNKKKTRNNNFQKQLPRVSATCDWLSNPSAFLTVIWKSSGPLDAYSSATVTATPVQARPVEAAGTDEGRGASTNLQLEPASRYSTLNSVIPPPPVYSNVKLRANVTKLVLIAATEF